MADNTVDFLTERLRRVPSQDRSRETVDVILEATEQLLAAYPPDEVTMARIAARAGVSVGSVYQYFADLQAIVSTLARRHFEDMVNATTVGLAQQGSPTERVDAVVDAVLATKRRAHRARWLHAAMDRAEVVLMLSDVQAAVMDALTGFFGELGHRDASIRARLLFAAVQGVLHELSEHHPEALHEPATQQHLRRIARSFLAD
ncbi:MAG: TetR/AcrR family transcriptional regulator [Myxococcales bacterium]|nr:TetR/AcrR family transcriptional regulator [Myxococcales bacterium]